MTTRGKKNHDLLAVMVAVVGLALTTLTFTNIPFVADAGLMIGVAMALPAEVYLCVLTVRGLVRSQAE